MRAVDVGATVGADGVFLTLPAVRVLVSRENAERLRDALSTVLPVQIDLEHDPRVSDLQVLRAARSLLGERGQDTENLAVAIDHIERDAAAGRAATQGGPQAAEDRARLYLLNVWGDVEPELSGPFKDERDRVEAAQDYRRAHGPEDGLFRVDATGSVKVDTFTGGELEPAPRRCVLCRCTATREVYGFAVCAYHVDHTEDDAPCPDCTNGPCPACEAWADGGRILSEEQWAAAVDALCAPCGVAGRTRGMHA
ncbi:MAG: hypothetical protein OXE53_06255 [Deltaproteobacteria bacterium]|nr:hypothetical protein [Deltaproteobacteria bacterium]